MTILYVLLAILIFGALILLHELGHYSMARLFHVTIQEFSVGMGPKLLQKKAKKTGVLWSLRALPVGGYVSMAGEDGECTDPNGLQNKPAWQRLIIMAAGGLTNLLIGFLLMTILVIGTRDGLGSTVIAGFTDPGEGKVVASESAGLAIGDEVLYVNRVRVRTANELLYEIMHRGDKPVTLTVRRDGTVVKIENVQFPTFTESGTTFGDYDFSVYAEEPTLGVIAKHSFFRSLSTVKMIWDSLIDLFSGRYGMESLSGPVGVTEVIVETAETRQIANLIFLTCVIAINLGVVNLLPFPALDGGRIFFVLIEMIRRKPVDRKIEGYVHGAGLILLLAFIAVITLKDVITLF